MESLKEDGGEDFSSLFEGMVLIDPFTSHDHSPPETATATEAEAVDEEKGGEREDSLVQFKFNSDSQQQSQSQPLDENLFSDLTLVHTDIPAFVDNNSHNLQSTILASSSSSSSSSSRKKKRGGFRIGYGRDASDPETKSPHLPPPYNNDDNATSATEIHGSTALHLPVSHPNITNSHGPRESPPHIEAESGNKSAPERSAQGDTIDHFDSDATAMRDQDSGLQIKPSQEKVNQIKPSQQQQEEDNENQIRPSQQQQKGEEEEYQINPSQQQQQQQQEHDPCSSIGDKLNRFRTHVSDKLERILKAVSSVSTAKKESVRMRRKAAEDVNSASLTYKDLEKELEEACESEDFERAEKVSEKLAAAEKDKETFVKALREAEAECNSLELKMQKILELQITTEEESASMLQVFAKDAADGADLILRNAEEFSSKEMEDWLSSTEALEIKKMELDIESHLINEAHSGLKDSIEKLIEDDRKEKELLIEKRDTLIDELAKLLVLVRLKEAEIAENNCKIQEVEKKIANVKSEFHNAQSSIDMKYDDLHRVFSEIESESEALSLKRKEVDDFMSEVERKRSKLMELARACTSEAKACQELAGLRKFLASSVIKSREDRASLAKTEEKILEDVKMLRQLVSAARASLQELSSTRVRVQQEIASLKQRIGFIDKRGPELDAEKKVAAAARNFKEAGRIATEAKALGMEKEELLDKMENAIFELDEVETKIKDTVDKLQDSERLISSKEKEVAMAGCKRLQLVATAAMAERVAALELGDLEEADILLAEADAANFEATELKQAYEFEVEEIGNKANNFIPMALIANLAGQELAEMATSMQANVVSGA